MNSIREVASMSELSLRGSLNDQTRLILINNAATSYVKLRGADALYDRLQHAVKLATNRSWDNFYQVTTWVIGELKQLADVEDCPGQAIRG
jgi:hypothetical protein